MATYIEIRQLFDNSDLRNKIEVAVIIAADTIRTELDTTVNHTNRLLWAKQVFSNPEFTSSAMLKAVLASNKNSSTQEILNASDNAIQSAVNDAIDILANGV